LAITPLRRSLHRAPRYNFSVTSPRTQARATEARNPRTRGLDTLSTRDILRAIHREDSTIAAAVAKQIPAIAQAADAMFRALRGNGRVFYVGAGTSGRLATLDAAEIPPTFGVPANKIQAIIAGGHRALTHAAEGAEDSVKQGARDLSKKRVTSRDVVIGIAASGGTPYVLGALKHARRAGAVTIGITSNRNAAISRAVDILIAPATGPEALAGSTRMKAGTAQKLVLNMLSTAAMVRLGRVYDNWMIGVALTNAKLRRRGVRILEEAAGVPVSEAARALRLAGHDPRVALIMLKSRVGASAAREKLRNAGDNLREALGEANKTQRARALSAHRRKR
jgi:N-acetylmuramic acid 6-phosphate etherase